MSAADRIKMIEDNLRGFQDRGLTPEPTALDLAFVQIQATLAMTEAIVELQEGLSEISTAIVSRF